MEWNVPTAAAALSVFVVAIPVLAAQASPRPGKGTIIEVVALSEVPDAARKALERAAQNHPLGVIVKRNDRGQAASYETTVLLGTSRWFVKVAPDGSVLERRRPDASPPPARPKRRPSPRPSA
jgi:hypothetical protein